MAANVPGGRKEFGQDLESEFFHREDQKLIERMRELAAKQSAREALVQAAGFDDPALIDKLTELGVRPELVAALSIVPIVEVAWADGQLDAKERAAVLDHARKSGIASGTPAHALLESWLQRKPEAGLSTAWTHLVEGLAKRLGPAEFARMREHVLEQARAVARASGGVLGLGSKVSKGEAAVLARIEGAFPTR